MCVEHILIVIFARTMPNQISRIYAGLSKFGRLFILYERFFGESLN